MSRLSRLQREVDRLFDHYQYGEAGRQVYEFFWSEFADWYLEIGKLQLDQGGGHAWATARTMVDILDTCLRWLHPFTPYVTESLWGHLKLACEARLSGFGPAAGWEPALIVARWPAPPKDSPEDRKAEAAFNGLMDLVRAIRNLRSERGVEPSRRIAAIIHAGELAEWYEGQRDILAALARASTLIACRSKLISRPRRIKPYPS